MRFGLTEISKRPAVEMDKLFKAEMLPHESLPLTLAPQEVFSLVIKVNASPLGSVEEVGTSRRHVHPSLLLTWKTAPMSAFLISQFSVPFPTPQAEQLLLTVSMPPMPISINTSFNIQVSLTNLASYPRSLAIEFPLPELRSIWQEGVHHSTTENPIERKECNLVEALVKARQRECTVVCFEKHVHLGRAEPKGELTANIRCVAAQPGIVHLEGIRVFDKHNRDDIRTYLIDSPIELVICPASTNLGLSMTNGPSKATTLTLNLSTSDEHTLLADDETELVLG